MGYYDFYSEIKFWVIDQLVVASLQGICLKLLADGTSASLVRLLIPPKQCVTYANTILRANLLEDLDSLKHLFPKVRFTS
jgi:hypothetical protein